MQFDFQATELPQMFNISQEEYTKHYFVIQPYVKLLSNGILNEAQFLDSVMKYPQSDQLKAFYLYTCGMLLGSYMTKNKYEKDIHTIKTTISPN